MRQRQLTNQAIKEEVKKRVVEEEDVIRIEVNLDQSNLMAEYEDAPIDLPSVKVREERINFAQNLNKTIVVPSVKDAGFKCKDCNEAFKDSSAYLDHVNSRRRTFVGEAISEFNYNRFAKCWAEYAN